MKFKKWILAVCSMCVILYCNDIVDIAAKMAMSMLYGL